MASQDPNDMSSKDNSSNQPWNYTALLSFNGNLELHLRREPRFEQSFFSEAAPCTKDESEKRYKKRARMDEDLAGLDPITVEKSYPIKQTPALLSLNKSAIPIRRPDKKQLGQQLMTHS